jgi:hypothetical protein
MVSRGPDAAFVQRVRAGQAPFRKLLAAIRDRKRYSPALFAVPDNARGISGMTLAENKAGKPD